MAKSKQKVLMPAGIRNKMMAAVSMLMVSAVMMVSSTYAWFTLSTAPEVKNISTTVAGNGSLEIALMPADGLFKNIKSGYSSANNGGSVAVATANTTWGNVIYLNDVSYGLEKVNLNPAQLSVSTGDATQFVEASKPLEVATYGYDGRIEDIVAVTTLKSFKDGAFKGTDYGVRAIGEADDAGVLGSTYGYAVDLAFRLNATNNSANGNAAGKLLLQTEGIQRIYNGDSTSTNAETLGGGSYMSFNANNTGLDMTTLMQAIRVTFVQDFGKVAESNTTVVPKILGTAKLDVEYAVKGPTDTTAKLYLYDAEDKALTGDNAVLLSAMEKNTAMQISAIVWLDGNMIQNASVSAISTALAQATLNLQFSTDVELKPANNNALFEGSAAD